MGIDFLTMGRNLEPSGFSSANSKKRQRPVGSPCAGAMCSVRAVSPNGPKRYLTLKNHQMRSQGDVRMGLVQLQVEHFGASKTNVAHGSPRW
jgi:hypothetical protein